ncbi:hypothetical protein Gpo141_00006311 [Globisporangium polare]
MNTASYYYPVDVPPLELPASQTRFPTLQPAGAFLKHMQSSYGSISASGHQQQQQQLKSAGLASPTSPSSVAVASSFLASIRRGLEDLVDDDEDDSDEDDDEDASPRYYSASNNNTYYSPPSSFGNQPMAKSSPSLFPSTQSAFAGAMASRNPLQQQHANDDDLIFDMEM